MNKSQEGMLRLYVTLVFGLTALFGAFNLGWGMYTVLVAAAYGLYGYHAENYSMSNKRSYQLAFGPLVTTLILIGTAALFFQLGGHFSASGWVFIVLTVILAAAAALEAIFELEQTLLLTTLLVLGLAGLMFGINAGWGAWSILPYGVAVATGWLLDKQHVGLKTIVALLAFAVHVALVDKLDGANASGIVLAVMLAGYVGLSAIRQQDQERSMSAYTASA